MTRMEAIIAARYAPLVLPQPLNALPADGYLKQLPKFTDEGAITAKEHLEAFYSFTDDHVIMHADVWMTSIVLKVRLENGLGPCLLDLLMGLRLWIVPF